MATPAAVERKEAAARRGLGPGGAVLAVLALLALIFPAFFTLPYHRDLAIKILLFATLAQAWNILAGYCCQVSLGHAVFFGTGAYTSSVLQMQFGVNPWIGLVVGAALAVALSQAIGYPCFRLRGHYFAIATIAIGEIIHTVAINWEFIGGARGLTLPIRKDSLLAFQFHGTKFIYYYIALALMVVCFLGAWHIQRSRIGYYLRAIRDATRRRASESRLPGTSSSPWPSRPPSCPSAAASRMCLHDPTACSVAVDPGVLPGGGRRRRDPVGDPGGRRPMIPLSEFTRIRPAAPEAGGLSLRCASPSWRCFSPRVWWNGEALAETLIWPS
jgi:hypothetical protein